MPTHIQRLHEVVALFGPLHAALRSPQPNSMHLPLYPIPQGLESGTYPRGGAARVDFKAAQIVYTRPSGEAVTLPFAEYSRHDLAAALVEAMKDDGHPVHALALPEAGGPPLDLDTSVTSEYANLQYDAFTGLARFRARISGHMTPIVVWPEHFDLSGLWFIDPAMDESGPHINVGFAPYTPGQYERPYFYAYAHPFEENTFDLPAPARWNLDGWTGIVVDYDQLAAQEDLALFIEGLSLDLFHRLEPWRQAHTSRYN
jgi:hypothetical protein